MTRWFLSLLLLANCAPFGDATPDTTSDEAATTPSKTASSTTPSSAASSSSSSTTNNATSTTSTASTASTTPEAALWPVVDKKVQIPVCWDSSFPKELRTNVEQMAKAQWNTLSPLSFNGWTDCADGDQTTVRFMGSSGASRVSGLGSMTGAQVVLDTDEDSDSIAADALHELGHIAGLGHEGYSSTDEANTCTALELGLSNDLPTAAPADRAVFDAEDSVMSRCHGRQENISQSDNHAIAKLYNVPPVDWDSVESTFNEVIDR